MFAKITLDSDYRSARAALRTRSRQSARAQLGDVARGNLQSKKSRRKKGVAGVQAPAQLEQYPTGAMQAGERPSN